MKFVFSNSTELLEKGEVIWQAPSNIALIKYWGKYGMQLPKNPSLSFTLSKCTTQTKLEFEPKSQDSAAGDFEVYFEGKPAEDFRPKIQQFFKRIETYVPFIKDYQFRIHTENTFPHSSGIASSASGMAALALCIMQMESLLNPEISDSYFYQKASFLARLGSGSAARSVQAPIMIWGAHPSISNSSNEYAIPNDFDLHPHFQNFQDTILIVDKGQKQVSSSLGHQLMNDHPFAEKRFEQAFAHLIAIVEILKNGDLDSFVRLVEREALALHAMMLTSMPYFILMKPNTLKIIEEVWKFRKANKSHLCFTLDAGANVHLLYPKHEKEQVVAFIENQLAVYCQNGTFILDELGQGPVLL